MMTANNHWPATLRRAVATLDFRMIDAKVIHPKMTSELRKDIHSLPSLIKTAVKAAIEMDDRVANERMESPVDRESILARKDLARALAAEPCGTARSPFTMGYDAAYRLRLEELVWKSIKDHPSLRLEELASGRG